MSGVSGVEKSNLVLLVLVVELCDLDVSHVLCVWCELISFLCLKLKEQVHFEGFYVEP